MRALTRTSLAIAVLGCTFSVTSGDRPEHDRSRSGTHG